MAILLCTDDMLTALPKSFLPTEKVIITRFKCSDRESLPTDFKRLYIDQEHDRIFLTQQSHIDKLPRLTPLAKLSDSSRPMTDSELCSHLTVAGRLFWISTATFPSSAFASSVSLQDKPSLSLFCPSRQSSSGRHKMNALLLSCTSLWTKIPSTSVSTPTEPTKISRTIILK